MYKQKPDSGKSDLLRYAGLGTQICAVLGIAVFAGYKLDKWLHASMPLATWILPLLVLCIMMYKLIKETSGRNNDETK